MAIPVLVVTPNVSFGELICQILDESGDYAIALTSKGQDALKLAKADHPALCILETDLNGTPVGELVGALKEIVPELLLILILNGEGSQANAIAKSQADGLLSKPVYLPDLVAKVEEVLKGSTVEDLDRAEKNKKPSLPSEHTSQPEEPQTEAPAWLQDVNIAAQHLTRLSLESSSQASLITKGDQIWAYAGELPRLAAEELARVVSIHFVNGGGSDLARFIRLEETGGEFMLYATGLGGNYVLATVFDAEMPFSKIRAQASSLAEALSTRPPKPLEEPAEDVEPEALVESTEAEKLWPFLEDVPPPIPNDWVPEPVSKHSQRSLLDELLKEKSADPFSSDTLAITAEELEPAQPKEASLPVPPQASFEPELPKYEAVAAPTQAQQQVVDYQAETVASKSAKKQEKAQKIVQTETLEQDGVDLEPVSPSLYSLTYACLLVPRFPEHYLTGDIATRLSDWITHLCVAFGWRLENLTIKPEYIQWLVNVPPNTSPGYLMRTVRQHTSRRMFIEFPAMEQDNFSGDFWAPGYLILGSPQPPPANLIQEFIQNTRKRQGLSI